ncbi:hypothetical protein L195_g053153, partial [Trifolium pratense]
MGTGFDSLHQMILNQPNHIDNSNYSGRPPGTPSPENSQHSYSTRISKVEFPRFDGKNVRDWLYKCEQFFLLDGTPPTSMVRLASIHLDGLALQWHLNYMRQKFDIYPTWNQYVTDVTTRFGDAFEDPLSSLVQIKHVGKVQEYVDQFELALTRVNLIQMFNPPTIAHAVNLAKLHEASKTTPPKPSRYSVNYPKSNSILFKPTTPSHSPPSSSFNTPPSPQKANLKPSHFRRSVPEMEERRSKGL